MNISASGVSTVSEAFKDLLEKIELNPSRVALASQRYKAVSDQITSCLPNKEVLQVGSFQRKTKIRPDDDNNLLDIDALVCFGDVYRYAEDRSGLSPQNALDSVRKALVSDEIYKLMSPYSNAPTVILEYSDGFKIELIPSFREKTGKYPRQTGPSCFIVGSSSGSWVPTDYDYDAAFISGLNQHQLVQKSLVPSIKMIKYFLRNKGIPLKSFHVEILCARIIPAALLDWNTKNLRWDYNHVLAYFLSNAHSLLGGPVSIPGSYSPPVNSSLTDLGLNQVGLVLKKYGDEAWGICKITNNDEAIEKWRVFFGESS